MASRHVQPKRLTPQQQQVLLLKQQKKAQRKAQTDAWMRAHPKARIAIYALIGVVALTIIGACGSGIWTVVQGAIAGASPTTTTQLTPTATTAAILAIQTTPTHQPTSQPTVQSTQKPTPKPTQATPHPTPTQQQVTPKPTQPACQAVNNNPWCYSFTGSVLIYVPPSGFCNYFNCIPTFYASDDPGDGYIIECQDTTYSQSGGESGACSHHGGELRPLYSH